MRFCLRVSERKSEKGCYPNRRFCFAVVDLDKAEAYPLNFVCTLPMQLSVNRKAENAFVNTFGDTSYELAQILLHKALKREQDPVVKDEIERRLKRLEPKPVVEKRCMRCRKIFQAKPKYRYKQKYLNQHRKGLFLGVQLTVQNCGGSTVSAGMWPATG